ncbi:MAG TPA: FapA family protein, partial [Stenomitos sp.]
LLARKTLPTQGHPGRAVNGESIPPVPGKDVHLLAGRNVELSANKLEAYALVMGVPKLVKNRVAVLPVFQVNDVDFSVGNINFQGSVLIRGNVNPGFSVKATEDVSVEGNVENAVIESGGSIRIRGGVRSGAKLTALKDIVVRFCDSNSTLSAGNDLVVKGDAVNCALTSRHKIQVDQHLIGGTARAAELIQVLIAGSQAETPTRLELVQDGDKEEIEKLKDDISSLENDLEGIATLIQQLMSKQRAEEGNLTLQKLMPVKVNMNIRLAQLKSQLKELTERHEALAPPRLLIKGEAFPGVLIHFAAMRGARTMRLTSKQFAKTYTFVDGEIQD